MEIFEKVIIIIIRISSEDFFFFLEKELEGVKPGVVEEGPGWLRVPYPAHLWWLGD